MRQQERKTEKRNAADRAARRRFVWQSFCVALGKHRRVFALAAVLAVALFCVSRIRCTLAVSMDGSFIGYVEDQERLDAIVDRVSRAASDALGHSWTAPTLTCRLAFAPASAEEEALIPFVEDENGTHCFTIPVSVLDEGIPCAAFRTAPSQRSSLTSPRTVMRPPICVWPCFAT